MIYEECFASDVYKAVTVRSNYCNCCLPAYRRSEDKPRDHAFRRASDAARQLPQARVCLAAIVFGGGSQPSQLGEFLFVCLSWFIA